MDRIPYGEALFYPDELIQCQSYHDGYACSYGGVAMSGGDETHPNTRVFAIRCAWVPVTASYRAKHLLLLLPEDPAPMTLLGIEKPAGVAARDPGMY
jgi:hypothetical protein